MTVFPNNDVICLFSVLEDEEQKKPIGFSYEQYEEPIEIEYEEENVEDDEDKFNEESASKRKFNHFFRQKRI